MPPATSMMLRRRIASPVPVVEPRSSGPGAGGVVRPYEPGKLRRPPPLGSEYGDAAHAASFQAMIGNFHHGETPLTPNGRVLELLHLLITLPACCFHCSGKVCSPSVKNGETLLPQVGPHVIPERQVLQPVVQHSVEASAYSWISRRSPEGADPDLPAENEVRVLDVGKVDAAGDAQPRVEYETRLISMSLYVPSRGRTSTDLENPW